MKSPSSFWQRLKSEDASLSERAARRREEAAAAKREREVRAAGLLPATMPGTIYLQALDGSQLGPYTESELRTKLKAGSIKPDAMAWKEGTEQWAELASLVSPGPVQPPQHQAKAVHRSGAIELTSKKWKFLLLWAHLMTVYAVFWGLVAFAKNESLWKPIGMLILIVIWRRVTRFLIWWNHK